MDLQNDAPPAARPTSRRVSIRLAVVLILALTPLLFYGAMVFEHQEPAAPDTRAVQPFGIWGEKATERLGTIPGWYPYIFCGMPSYGSFLYTPRNPLDVVGQALQLFQGNRGARYVLLFCLAGIGAYAFFRRQGFGHLASTTSALLFSMTPYFPGVVAAGHSTKLEALCLTPGFLLAFDFLLKRPGPASAALLAVAGALVGWAHHPQIAYYGALLVFLYGIGYLFVEKRGQVPASVWLRLGVFLGVASVLAAMLLADPYLAVREYAPYSIRGASEAAAGASAGAGVGWNYATAWSFHPAELISFLFPGWYGFSGQTYWGRMPFTQSTQYFGLIALALAVFGLLRMGGRRKWIWAGISLVLLLVGFGRFLPVLYGPMYKLLPLFNRFRVPSMIYSLLPLSLGYLIAGGLESVVRLAADGDRGGGAGRGAPAGAAAPRSKHGSKAAGRSDARKKAKPPVAPRSRRVLYAIGAVVAVWILVLLGARAGLSGPTSMLHARELAQGSPSGFAPLQSVRMSILLHSVDQGCALLVASLLLVWLAASGRLPRRWSRSILGAGLAVLAVGDVLLVGGRFYHTEPVVAAQETVPVAGAADYLAGQPGRFRIFPVDDLFTTNAFGLRGIESIGGYQPAKLRAYQDLIDAGALGAPAVLRMLNVRYLVSRRPLDLGTDPVFSGDGYVYPLPQPLPRVWSVSEIETVGSPGELFLRLVDRGFAPDRTALLYRDGDLPEESRFAPAQVSLEEDDIDEIRIRSESDGPAFLVLSEIEYPPSWRASVDGQDVPIYRTNHVLRGVRVPSGAHEVVLRLVSTTRRRGSWLSRMAGLATALLLAAGLLPPLLRRRSPATRAASTDGAG